MDVHIHSQLFSDRPTVDHYMEELALKHTCVVGEAHYQPSGSDSYYKVYIALKNLWDKKQLRNFMRTNFQGADIVCAGGGTLVFEIPIETKESTLHEVHKKAKDIFASWV